MERMDGQPEQVPVEPLWQLAINETRLHSERTNFFLVASAFLVAAFAILRQESDLGIQFVPLAVGVAFSFLHFININYGESVLRLWEGMLKNAGDAPSKILSERDGFFNRTWWLKPWPGPGLFTRNIGSWVLPALFLAMWITLIVIEAAIRLRCDSPIVSPS